jgi:hypothetical protein
MLPPGIQEQPEDEDPCHEPLGRVPEIALEEEKEIIEVGGPGYRDGLEDGIEPLHGFGPHRVQDLVGEDADTGSKGGNGAPVFPEGDPDGNDYQEERQRMKQESSLPGEGRKEEITEGFVHEIREDRPDGTRDDPAVIMEEIPREETQQDTRDQVEEEIHAMLRVFALPQEKLVPLIP